MLFSGIADCEPVITDAITVLMNPKEMSEMPTWSFCHTLNMSQCSTSENARAALSGQDEGTRFSLLVYNPMSFATDTYLRLPVLHHSFTVKDHQDQDVDVQVTPLIMSVQNIPERTSFAKTELVFLAQLPPLGYTTFQVTGHASGAWLQRRVSWETTWPFFNWNQNAGSLRMRGTDLRWTPPPAF